MRWPLLTAVILLAPAAESLADGLDPERVDEVTAMLRPEPMGLGRPLADRAAWREMAQKEVFGGLVRTAERLLSEPLPEQPDDLYLDFSRTGNRTHWQEVANRRRSRLAPLVIAECLEDQGRFLPAFEELVRALSEERTWVMPAHDRKLTNFNGETVDIDLASSALGWHLATADWLLADRLSADVRELLRDNVRRRVLVPYRDMFTGARPANWWTKTTNNWNAVCLAGVTGAALAQVRDAHERAQFVRAAEEYSRSFLRGFTSDGYCSEGLGYWNYGFGHYVLLSETIRQATSGGVDLLARPEARAPATFGARIGIIGGVYPAFADCSVNARPDFPLVYFVNRVFGLGLDRYDELPAGAVPRALASAMLYAFPNSASEAEPSGKQSEGPGLRTWFDQAGILISRPVPESECYMGVALKGGHNAEHHNHNDVGSYVVAVGDRAVLLDPGSEVYTARTFSNRRYESKLLNSYGHPVPVVAGQLQRPGREAQAEVLATDFADEADMLQLDLSAAYEVPVLEELTRTFVYSRAGAGSLTVTDRVRFAEPRTFETALITRGEWIALDDGVLQVYDFSEAVEVHIISKGADFTIGAEEIRENARVQPTRLGIKLTEPVTAASIEVTITPSDGPGAAEQIGLLKNGGFEYGDWGWVLPTNSLGTISTELAASGEASLKISDPDDRRGSNISSAPMRVDGAGEFVLRGKVYHVSGEGIGMYIKLLDAEGDLLNETDERGWIGAIGALEGEAGEWVDFEFPFTTTPETVAIQLWIHSYSSAVVEAYVDDIVIVAADDR